MTKTLDSISAQLESRFRAARDRSRAIFDMLTPEAYASRPILLRHPLVFYDGHLDAFLFNLVLKGALGQPSFNPAFDALFARGIDPETAAQTAHVEAWPDRAEIARYKADVAERLFAALRDPASYERDGLKGGELFFMGLEHELMHQETLTYLLHQLPRDAKRRPAGVPAPRYDAPPAAVRLDIPAGTALLGARAGEFPFTWDNERPAIELAVPAFGAEATLVTNADYLAFVEDGGYENRACWDEDAWAWRTAHDVRHPAFWRRGGDGWLWRGFFEDHPLPPAWPVHVTHAEARAYARWAGKALPTEAEWHRLALGDRQDAPYPWGDEPPTSAHGNFGFSQWGPTPVGAYPLGQSPLGAHDVAGNVWEWTSTPFAPFDGFEAHPAYAGYSADFFDGKHFVMKGGSWATDPQLLRRSFRNWFYGHYPYMYAGFRLVTRH
jgi:ergothioneine biosynthesis protein EgtB